MAKSKTQGADIDWYLISIDKLKRFGIIFGLVLLAIGGYFYYDYKTSNPKQRAQTAISDADDLLNRIATSKDFNTYREDFERGRAKLEEARALLTETKFPEALTAASDAQGIAQAVLSRVLDKGESDAQFLGVEGEVSYQKSGNDWKAAEARTPLFNGDWVKTGNNSTAELMFSNGSLYTVGQNALLEIYSLVNPATSKKQNTVKMQIGTIEVNTDDELSTVKTPGTQIVVESKSTAQVGVDQTAKSTQVLNLRGSALVSSISGGAPIKLASGERVRATKEGTLSDVKKVVLPPALLVPADNQVYQGQADLDIELKWTPPPGAANYQLQVSRSRMFSTVAIDSKRKQPRALVRATDEGSFYWRVASIDAGGEVGPFSTFRRFGVTGLGRTSLQQPDGDKTPPRLEVVVRKIGSQFYMVEGRVEPGASLFVNDEEIDVDSSGTFRKLLSLDKLGPNVVVIKAVDSAGNPNVIRENINVEE